MAIVVEATYENGVLRPNQALPLKEHEKVRIIIQAELPEFRRWQPFIPCGDAELIERVALDPELEF
jgi:predicted DNA-binding antitoxin AbrB/MazE fold protein